MAGSGTTAFVPLLCRPGLVEGSVEEGAGEGVDNGLEFLDARDEARHELERGRVGSHALGQGRDRIRTFVKRLRRKLGDDPARPTYVLNERGIGYRVPRPEE